MTQEYEPIKLTESTPEPEDRGLYLIMESDSPVIVDSFWLDTNGFLYEGEVYSWSEILDIHADKHALYRLVSLAAHDAQIRADEHVRAMEDAYSNSDEAYLGKYIEALDIVIKAVAQYRKEQKQ
jgi:hypothetical protein